MLEEEEEGKERAKARMARMTAEEDMVNWTRTLEDRYD